MAKHLACSYQGFDFGASYPDSICIAGQLYDADACDDSGNLYEPMEYIACPQCNHAQWLNDQRDEIEEMGYIAACDGVPRAANPFTVRAVRYPKDRRRYIRWWVRGYRQAMREGKAKERSND